MIMEILFSSSHEDKQAFWHACLDRMIEFLRFEVGYVLLDDARPYRGGVALTYRRRGAQFPFAVSPSSPSPTGGGFANEMEVACRTQCSFGISPSEVHAESRSSFAISPSCPLRE
jgi:hypothetical protein